MLTGLLCITTFINMFTVYTRVPPPPCLTDCPLPLSPFYQLIRTASFKKIRSQRNHSPQSPADLFCFSCVLIPPDRRVLYYVEGVAMSGNKVCVMMRAKMTTNEKGK